MLASFRDTNRHPVKRLDFREQKKLSVGAISQQLHLRLMLCFIPLISTVFGIRSLHIGYHDLNGEIVLLAAFFRNKPWIERPKRVFASFVYPWPIPRFAVN